MWVYDFGTYSANCNGVLMRMDELPQAICVCVRERVNRFCLNDIIAVTSRYRPEGYEENMQLLSQQPSRESDSIFH